MQCRNPDCRKETRSGYFMNLEGSGRHKEPLCPACWEDYVRRMVRESEATKVLKRQ